MRGDVMLKRVGVEDWVALPNVSIAKASFPSPFYSGLEFSAPARGTWTIVHVGMLVPEAHEIFVCAASCLRGVVLSAAEMSLTGRFSTVAIEEHNVLEGDMEDLIIEGVTDILNRLPKLPPAVMVYSSCIHHFVGCDLELCYNVLRERFPDVDFTDCYMIPTMRKSGLTPDQIMRRQLYSFLQPAEKDKTACSVIGNCFSLADESDLVKLIRRAGYTLYQIPDFTTYREYRNMEKSSFCVTTQPVAKVAGETLEMRLGQTHLYLPFSWRADEIRSTLQTLAQRLGVSYDGGEKEEQEALQALDAAQKTIGDTPIAIDYTFTSRPLGLAKLLLEHGFQVRELYLDVFNPEEKEEYLWLREHAPEVQVFPTVHASMRKLQRSAGEKILALGQKAAYFTGTGHFVNLVENGELYGFYAISRLAAMMEEAYEQEKDTEKLIQIKGLGCASCV